MECNIILEVNIGVKLQQYHLLLKQHNLHTRAGNAAPICVNDRMRFS